MKYIAKYALKFILFNHLNDIKFIIVINLYNWLFILKKLIYDL